MTTFNELLTSRHNYHNGKCRGREWEPVELPFCPLEHDNGVPETISKILALALQLEIPVGQWVGEATKKELPISEVARELLLSNIGDEIVHEKAFRLNSPGYLMEKHNEEAEAIFKEWNVGSYHPLERACYAEVGVFLISLAVMRLAGGESLYGLAGTISRDEYRHISTNKGVLQEIGYDFRVRKPINRLVEDTLGWLLGELKLPGMDLDFFMEQSRLLIVDGYAPELQELTQGAQDDAFFESPNRIFY